MKKNNNIFEFFKLEDRVLFEAAAVAEIVEAQANDPNADMNVSDQKAQDEKNAIKNAPVDNQADADAKYGDPSSMARPDEVADIDAEINALIEGEIGAPVAGMEAVDQMIDELFNDYGAGAVNDAIEDAFAESDEPEYTVVNSDVNVSTDSELVIINSSVKDIDQIINSLGANQEYLVLESGKDAMQQINDYLDASGKEYGAIHILSHGNTGYITLAGEVYDAGNFDAAAWAAVGEHLNEGGDILLYGCNLAGDEAGQQLVDLIADATGADVAASADTTGLTGNWDLEYSTGDINTVSITVEGYNHDLASGRYIVDTLDDVVDDTDGKLSLREALELANNYNADNVVIIEFDSSLGSNSTLTITLDSSLGELSYTNTNAALIINGAVGTDGIITIDADGGSRVFNLGAGATATLGNINMQNGSADNGGVIYTGVNSTLTLDNAKVSGGSAINGGGIYSTGTLNITNGSEVSGNTANATTASNGYGGGIYATGSTTVSDSTISGNTANAMNVSGTNSSGRGGGIYATGSVTVSDSEISGNKAASGAYTTYDYSGYGGGIYAGGEIDITNSTVSGNTAGGTGGGIYSAGSADINISGSEFTANAAVKGHGGALYINGSGEVNISNSNFGLAAVEDSGNSAGGNGGAIYINGAVAMTLAGTNFYRNSAGKTGGAIHAGSATNTINITGGEFGSKDYAASGNKVTATTTDVGGGAIYLDIRNTLNTTGTNFYYNAAAGGKGGAIYVIHSSVSGNWVSSTVTLNGGEFGNAGIAGSGNTAGYSGGAIHSTGVVTVNSANFYWNSTTINFVATYGGGAIMIGTSGTAMANPGMLILKGDVTFANNSSAKYGGAILVADGGFQVADGAKVTIGGAQGKGNTALSGGGIYFSGLGNGGFSSSSTATVNVSYNTATAGGGGLYLNGATVALDWNFASNTAVDGGAIFSNGGSSLTINSGNYTSNTATASGGAIYNAANNVTINGGTFSGNRATDGGVLYNTRYYVNINDGTFSNNTATGKGGVIYHSPSSSFDINFMTINGGTYTGNSADQGGVIYNAAVKNAGDNVSLYVKGGTYTKNTATEGGAIYQAAGGLAITAGTFGITSGTGNSATSGGALYLAGGTATVGSGVAFNYNTATNGGAIYTNVNLSLTGVLFQSNTASQGGGAIYVNGGTTTIGGATTFATTTSLTDAANGGAIYVSGTGAVNFTSAITFANYKASVSGGAIYVAAGGKMTAPAGLIFNSNQAAVNGGAIYLESGDYSFSNFIFDSNRSTSNGQGGAVYLGSGTLTVAGSTFKLNYTSTASGQGGAIYVGSGNVNITSSTFQTNRSSEGGAVYVANGNVNLTGKPSTFTTNWVTIRGGAIYASGSVTDTAGSSFTGNYAKGNHSVTTTTPFTVAGGAIYSSSANLTGTKFSGNYAADSFNSFALPSGSLIAGGAVYTTGDITLNGVTFDANNAGSHGGAVYAGGDLNITGYSTFTGNNINRPNLDKWSVYGGAVYVAGNLSITNGANFTGNFATSGGAYSAQGGAVYVVGTANINNVTFADNYANKAGTAGNPVGEGGALFIKGTGNSSISGSTFTNNTSYNEGGAVWSNSVLTVIGSTFSGNHSGWGGAMLLNNTTVINGSTFENNSAHYGGAISTRNDVIKEDLTINDSIFRDNTADVNGGAISFGGYSYLERTLTINGNTLFTGNTTDGSGGAIYIYSTGAKSAVTIHIGTLAGSTVTFSGNIARSGSGGAIYNEGYKTTDIVIGNAAGTVDFTGNTAGDHGGAVYAKGGTTTVTVGANGSNVTFSGNTATNRSGAIHGESYYGNTVINVTGTFKNNTAGTDGGAIFAHTWNTSGATINLTVNAGSVFSGNRAGANGGAIIAWNTVGNITVDAGGEFTNNTAGGRGGAIHANAAGNLGVTINSATFDTNKAVGGGAVYAYAAGTVNMIVNGSTFENNVSNNSYGGAIYAYALGNLTLSTSYSSFVNNSATSYGGAIYGYSTAAANLSVSNDSTFKGNKSNASGGAIYFRGSGIDNTKLTIVNAIFDGNKALGGDGGAIWSWGLYTINNSYFQNNTASGKGGAIFNSYGSVTINGGSFESNSAADGGAIYLQNTWANSSSITDTSFSGNKATSGSGGAVWLGALGTLTVNNATFSDNTAKSKGGAFYSEGTLSVNGSKVTDNTAGTGGGIYAANGVTVTGRSQINDNTATGGGGGGIYSGGAVTVRNSEVSGNTTRSSTGGGIHINSGAVLIDNSKVSNNFATGAYGGGIYHGGSGTITIDNGSEVSGNTASSGGGIYANGGVSAITVDHGSKVNNNTAVSPGTGTYIIRGGGIYVGAGNNNTVTVRIDNGSEVNGNKATGGSGGGIYSLSTTNINGTGTANIIVANGSSVSGNSASTGGGIAADTLNGSVSVSIESGSRVNNNTAVTNGGGIYAYSYSTVTVSDSEVNNNTAGSNGGGIYSASVSGRSTVNITNSDVNNNVSSVNGGGVYIKNSVLTATGSTFDNNRAVIYGGAIRGETGVTINLIDSTVSNNTAAIGGGIYAGETNMMNSYAINVTNSTISGNTATESGGGIYIAMYGKLVINGGSTISGNTAQYGGGIYAGTYATVQIADSTVTGNKAITSGSSEAKGGGIYAEGNSYPFTIVNSTVSDNIARSTGSGRAMGGGIFSAAGNTLTITGSTISGNTVQGASGTAYGGGIFSEGASTLTVNNTTVSGNRAIAVGGNALGGGIFGGVSSQVTVNNGSVVSGNSATSTNGEARGGGINISQNGTLDVNNAKINGNTAGTYGGGIYGYTGSKINVSNSELNSNTAGTSGGAVYAIGGLTVSHSEFRQNSAARNGGAVYSSGTSVTMDNTLIADNSATGNGGGIHLANTAVAATLTNLTIANNKAAAAGGIYTSGGNVTLRNSILWGNTGGQYVGLDQAKVFNSAIQDWAYTGNGNVNLQAANAGSNGSKVNDNEKGVYYVSFVDAGNSNVGRRDYNLDSGSYLINRGSNNYVNSATDLNGNDRIHNQAGGGRVDMGAYESGYKGNVVLNAEGTDIVYGDTGTLSAGQDGYGGGSFSYTGDPDYLYVNGDQATAIKAGGNVDVKVEYSGDANWNSRTTTATVTTSKRDVTIKAGDANYTYNGQNHQFNWDGNIGGRGLAFNDALTSYDANGYRNAGTYTDALYNALISSGSGDNMSDNYNITYETGTMVIDQAVLTVNRDGEDKVYNGNTNADYTWNFDGLIDGDDVNYNKGNAQFGDKNVGKNKDITYTGDSLNGTDLGNYRVVYSDSGADITKATLTVNRDGEDKVYNGNTNADYIWSFDGLIDGDDVTYGKGNAQFSDKNVGEDKNISYTGEIFGGADFGNYDIAYNDSGADITKATLTVNRDGEDKVYDGSTNADYTWNFDGLIDGDDVTYGKGNAQFGDKNVGKNKDITYTGEIFGGADFGNYDIAYNDSGADITEATLTVNRDGKDKVYDGSTNADYTWNFDGLIDGDDVTYGKGNAQFGDKNVGKNKDITYTGETFGGDDLGNYKIMYSDTGADITKATLTVNRDGEDKVYNGNTNADYTWSFDGLIDGDDVTYGKGNAQFGDKNVGENKNITYTGETFGGADFGNYEIMYNDSGADITEATLTVNRDGKDKVYDGSTNADYTWNLDGLIDGDDVTYGKGNAQFGDKNVGENKNITYTGETFGGDDLGNYKVVYNDNGADITKATLTVNRDGEDKVYDGNTNADYSWSFDGLVDGDNVNYNKGNAQFGDRNVGTDKNVTISGDSLSGDDLGNYEIMYSDSGADITRADLVIVINDAGKTVGDVDPAFSGSTSGLVGGDSVTGYDRTDKGETAGQYAIDQYQVNDGNDGNNYNVVVVKGTLTINAPAAASTNIYMDASSRNYVINGMDQASLVQTVSVISANRDADTVLDTETDGNVSSASHQTTAKAESKAKAVLKETSQKKSFEEYNQEAAQNRNNTLLTKASNFSKGEKTSIVESQYKLNDKSDSVQVPSSDYSSQNTSFESDHPMHTMPSNITIDTNGINVVNFSGADLANVTIMEKAENLKDKLDVILDEMMNV